MTRLLVAIPHAYVPDGIGPNGSHVVDPARRIAAVTECLDALGRLSTDNVRLVDMARRTVVAAPQREPLEVAVVMCTTGDIHLLDHIGPALRRGRVEVLSRPLADPRHLGHEAHRALAERIDEFDVFGYLEDDLAVRDVALLRKIAWFSELVGDHAVLLPHRFERGRDRRVYIDGALPERHRAQLPVIAARPPIEAEHLGRPVRFEAPVNPHSGCFFLSAAQLRTWMDAPTFLDGDDGFVGPLESASALGLHKVFSLYKPAFEDASFAEVEHLDTRWAPSPR